MGEPGFDWNQACLALSLKIPELSCLKACRHLLTTPSAPLKNLSSGFPHLQLSRWQDHLWFSLAAVMFSVILAGQIRSSVSGTLCFKSVLYVLVWKLNLIVCVGGKCAPNFSNQLGMKFCKGKTVYKLETAIVFVWVCYLHWYIKGLCHACLNQTHSEMYTHLRSCLSSSVADLCFHYPSVWHIVAPYEEMYLALFKNQWFFILFCMLDIVQ